MHIAQYASQPSGSSKEGQRIYTTHFHRRLQMPHSYTCTYTHSCCAVVIVSQVCCERLHTATILPHITMAKVRNKVIASKGIQDKVKSKDQATKGKTANPRATPKAKAKTKLKAKPHDNIQLPESNGAFKTRLKAMGPTQQFVEEMNFVTEELLLGHASAKAKDRVLRQVHNAFIVQERIRIHNAMFSDYRIV
jgi:hypothetical protein